MRCISPIRLKSGDIVPCGKCNFCLMTRRIDWSFRLAQELKVSTSAKFVTMTYEDSCLRYDNGVAVVSKRDVQLFLKRLRKYAKLRYYCVGEYGERFERPHYHMLLFNFPLEKYPLVQSLWYDDDPKKLLGTVHIGDVNGASIYYTCKYHVNPLGRSDGRAPPFALMSRRPGIGCNYIDTHRRWHRRGLRNYTQVNGVVSRLPRYYKEKFFTDLERQKLALEAVSIGDVDYWKEVERLASLYNDPEGEIESRLLAMCEKISMKSPIAKF